jgi:hypothetical protein
MSCMLFTITIKSEFKTYEILYKILKIRQILCQNSDFIVNINNMQDIAQYQNPVVTLDVIKRSFEPPRGWFCVNRNICRG